MTVHSLVSRPWLALTVALFGLVPAASANAYRHTEPIQHEGAFSADGVVRISNVNGDITVRTWDREEIRVEGKKSAQTDEELRAIELTMNVSNQRAEIRVKLPKRKGWVRRDTIRAKVELTLYVPRTVTLDELETVNSTIRLDGLAGTVRAETVNGRIEADGLGGNADLETVNGRIVAKFAQVRAGQKIELESVNGSLEVILPEDAGAKLDAELVNGRVECDFPLAMVKSRGKRSLSGTIGDGRAELDLETVNGQIRVRRQ